MTDEKIVQELAQKNEAALGILINRYQGKFVRWAKKNRLYFDDQTLADAFVDAVIRLYEHIQTKQFTWQKQGGLQSYLFKIGKFQLINQLEKIKNRERHQPQVQHAATDWLFKFDPNREQEIMEMSSVVAKMVGQLGDSCQQLLKLYEFEGHSMKEIAQIMGFESENVAKSRKYQCLQQLRKLAKTQYSKEDFFLD